MKAKLSADIRFKNFKKMKSSFWYVLWSLSTTKGQPQQLSPVLAQGAARPAAAYISMINCSACTTQFFRRRRRRPLIGRRERRAAARPGTRATREVARDTMPGFRFAENCCIFPIIIALFCVSIVMNLLAFRDVFDCCTTFVDSDLRVV